MICRPPTCPTRKTDHHSHKRLNPRILAVLRGCEGVVLLHRFERVLSKNSADLHFESTNDSQINLRSGSMIEAQHSAESLGAFDGARRRFGSISCCPKTRPIDISSRSAVRHRLERSRFTGLWASNVSFSVTSGEPNHTLSETIALWLTARARNSRRTRVAPRAVAAIPLLQEPAIGSLALRPSERASPPRPGLYCSA